MLSDEGDSEETNADTDGARTAIENGDDDVCSLAGEASNAERVVDG